MALTEIPIELSSTPGIVDNSNATAITIDASENVGIGTSSIDGTLHVHTASAGTVTASTQADDLVIENSAEGGMTIITPDDQSARIRFTSPSTNNDVGGATIFYRQNINKMLVGTAVSGGVLALASGAGNESLVLASNGAATFSGNVGTGGATASEKLVSAGTVRALGTTLTSASSATLSYTGTTSRLESRGGDVSTRGAIELMQATSNGSSEIVALGFNAAGAATFASTIAAGAATFTTADNSANLTLISTDADASAGPVLDLYRNSASPANNDFLGNITFRGRNNNSQDVQFAEVEVYVTDVTDGAEDGLVNYNVMTNGSNLSYLQLRGETATVVINEDGADLDFRVESDTKDHAFFVEGEGSSNRLKIGMGTGTITNPYSQNNFTDVNIDGVWGSAISFKMGGTEKGWIGQRSSGNEDMVLGASSGQELHLFSNAVLAQKISVAGEVTQPLQPAFSATVNAAQNNIAINTDVTIVFGAETFDVGSNFASNTFTAPVTGKYQLNLLLRLDYVDSAADYYIVSFFTSNNLYRFIYDLGGMSSGPVYWSTSLAVLADMDASDTAYITVNQAGGSAQTDILSHSSYNRFSGYLVA